MQSWRLFLTPPQLRTRKTVRLEGGLGNQMWMYAFGQKLKHETGCRICYDKTIFDETAATNELFAKNGARFRKYALDIFNLKLSFTPVQEVQKLRSARKVRLNAVLRKLFKIPKYVTDSIRETNPFEFDENLLTSNKKYFEGYFQNPKYLEGIENQLRKNFIFPPINDAYNLRLLKKIQSCENSVFIHIRRDDYLNLDWALDINYYQKALEKIYQKIKNPHFFIFGIGSEDFIKENFNLHDPYEIIGDVNAQNNQDWKDMFLMTNCRHGIIANSTFSWWGAWLGGQQNKLIIAPDPFVMGSNGILLPNWEKIKWKEN